MPSQKGRDLLLKIGNGGSPETFSTLGAARTVAMSVNNQLADATSMDSAGIQSLQADAGIQSMKIMLEGLFKDENAEESLRSAAFARTTRNYKLQFPNGDSYMAAFAVQDYERGGSYDGLETFRVTLVRSGDGTYTSA